MIIKRLKTDHVTNPFGFTLASPAFPGSPKTPPEKRARRRLPGWKWQPMGSSTRVLYDSGRRADIDSLAFPLPLELTPCTRYHWRVTVWADNGETTQSETAWFETAKMSQPWQAQWITRIGKIKRPIPCCAERVYLPAGVVSARAYVLRAWSLQAGNQRQARGRRADDPRVQCL